MCKLCETEDAGEEAKVNIEVTYYSTTSESEHLFSQSKVGID